MLDRTLDISQSVRSKQRCTWQAKFEMAVSAGQRALTCSIGIAGMGLKAGQGCHEAAIALNVPCEAHLQQSMSLITPQATLQGLSNLARQTSARPTLPTTCLTDYQQTTRISEKPSGTLPAQIGFLAVLSDPCPEALQLRCIGPGQPQPHRPNSTGTSIFDCKGMIHDAVS